MVFSSTTFILRIYDFFIFAYVFFRQCDEKVANLLTYVLLHIKELILEKIRTYITKYQINLLEKDLVY